VAETCFATFAKKSYDVVFCHICKEVVPHAKTSVQFPPKKSSPRGTTSLQMWPKKSSHVVRL